MKMEHIHQLVSHASFHIVEAVDALKAARSKTNDEKRRENLTEIIKDLQNMRRFIIGEAYDD